MTKEQWELLDVHLMRLNEAVSDATSKSFYLQRAVRDLRRNRKSMDTGSEFGAMQETMQENCNEIRTLLQECLDELDEVRKTTQST